MEIIEATDLVNLLAKADCKTDVIDYDEPVDKMQGKERTSLDVTPALTLPSKEVA
jgi:hypothetical protein